MQPNTFYPSSAASNPYSYQYVNMTNDSDIIWGQGEAGAKSYPVQPGHKKLIMDSEANRFFIKEVDINGIPLPLRIFEYSEVTPQPQVTQPAQPIDMSAYATKEEINELKDLIKGLKEDLNNKNRNNRRDNKVNNG